MNCLQLQFLVDDKTDSFRNIDIAAKQYGPWIVTDKGDQDVRRLYDRHYTRKPQQVGNKQFTRPGRNLVLKTEDDRACWVTWSGIRDDGYDDAWECTIFRNEGSELSSELIKWAIYASVKQWGRTLPKNGMITYVDTKKVASKNAGYCYERAGFKRIGRSKSRGLLCLWLDLNHLKLIMKELYLKNYLVWCQEQLQLALDSGEWMETEYFQEEATETEAALQELKRAMKSEKLKAWSSYDPTMSREDLLAIIAPELLFEEWEAELC